MTNIALRGASVRLLLSCAVASFALVSAPGGRAAPQLPMTRAEASGYRETSSFADVVDFLRKLQSASGVLRVETVIHTAEGKSVPMAVVADPLPGTSARRPGDTRPVVMIQANIHAGEVEGKEASLALLRDMVAGGRRGLLKKAIFLFVPVFNADGNDRISPKNRDFMPNPEKGVGIRQNSQNYDLNRDYVKTESREVRGVLGRVIRAWDPLVYVDLHTTDGSYHKETVTWLSPRAPNWDPGISGYVWDSLFPELGAALRKRGVRSTPYGDFVDDMAPGKGWATSPPYPRVGADYMGLRNRFAILVEMYAYAPFQTRVEHCLAFLEELVDRLPARLDAMRRIAADADRRAESHASSPEADRAKVCLEVKAEPLEKPVTIVGFEMSQSLDGTGRHAKPIIDKEKTYVIPYFARFVPVRERPLPWGYFLKPGCDRAVRQLLRHGVRVKRLLSPVSAMAKQFQTKELKVDERVSEGHSRLTLSGEWADAAMDAEAGWFFVPTGQPLAMLTACLLEPDHPESLFSWNFLDNWVTRQWSKTLPPLPIYRVSEPVKVVSEAYDGSDPEY